MFYELKFHLEILLQQDDIQEYSTEKLNIYI